MIQKHLRMLRILAVVAATSLLAGTANACPSCKAANESNSRLPLAYQASILFMLGVPGTMVSCLGVMLYRLNKEQVLAMQAFENGDVWQPDLNSTN